MFGSVQEGIGREKKTLQLVSQLGHAQCYILNSSNV